MNVQTEKELQKNLESITYACEGPSVLIAEKLKENGYAIAGHGGVRIKKPLQSFVGILKDKMPIEKRFIGVKWNKNQRAYHLGRLWLNNSEKGADENCLWILDVYGRTHVSSLKKIVESISKYQGIQLKVNIKSEYPAEENYLNEL